VRFRNREGIAELHKKFWVVTAQTIATMYQKQSLPVIIPAGSCNIGKTNWTYSAWIV